jgi:hypothetical protein
VCYRPKDNTSRRTVHSVKQLNRFGALDIDMWQGRCVLHGNLARVATLLSCTLHVNSYSSDRYSSYPNLSIWVFLSFFRRIPGSYLQLCHQSLFLHLLEPLFTSFYCPAPFSLHYFEHALPKMKINKRARDFLLVTMSRRTLGSRQTRMWLVTEIFPGKQKESSVNMTNVTDSSTKNESMWSCTCPSPYIFVA